MSSRKPDKVIRIGYVSASIFSNELEGENGKYLLHSVVIQKRYMEGNQVKYTSSFGLSELPLAARVLQLAQHWVEEQEAHVQLD